jgi:hypothetical protein
VDATECDTTGTPGPLEYTEFTVPQITGDGSGGGDGSCGSGKIADANFGGYAGNKAWESADPLPEKTRGAVKATSGKWFSLGCGWCDTPDYKKGLCYKTDGTEGKSRLRVWNDANAAWEWCKWDSGTEAWTDTCANAPDLAGASFARRARRPGGRTRRAPPKRASSSASRRAARSSASRAKKSKSKKSKRGSRNRNQSGSRSRSGR